MVVVLNLLFSSCCKLGTRGAGKFERAFGLKALASDKSIPWEKYTFLIIKSEALKCYLDLKIEREAAVSFGGKCSLFGCICV